MITTLDPNLQPLTTKLNALQDELDDLLWSGLETNQKITLLEHQISECIEKLTKGELYEPLF